jgi:hypothetical protein
MTDGILRARFRRGFDTEVFLEPGVADSFEIDAWSIGHVFNSGHRIRVIISSSNYPRFEKNPNTGAPFMRDDPITLVATNIVHMSPSMLSRVEIPFSPLIPAQIAESRNIPNSISIETYPNPFNSAVTISFDYGSESAKPLSTIEIFDVNGRKVDDGTVGANCIRPFDGSTPTTREFTWRPDESLPSGVYLVRAHFDTRSPSGAEATVATKRVVYLK